MFESGSEKKGVERVLVFVNSAKLLVFLRVGLETDDRCLLEVQQRRIGFCSGAKRHRTDIDNPDFGYSGMRLADIDGDGDLDVLVTNGDATDIELLKPQHSVRLLENRGRYPLQPHLLTALPGAYDVVVADLDNDGD